MNFYEFCLMLEGQKDEDFRKEAKSIADRIIAFIDSNKARDDGLPYTWRPNGTKFGDSKFYLSSIIPEHPNLKLSFTNNYLTQHGEFSGQTLYIALPSRTREVATIPIYVRGNYLNDVRGIHPAVSKFLKKPNNYNTLVHEIIHYLDSKRTKGKVFKNYPSDYEGSDYHNHPSETNAWLQAFLVGLDRNISWQEVMLKLKQEYWFVNLNERKKRQAINRVYSWFSLPNDMEK